MTEQLEQPIETASKLDDLSHISASLRPLAVLTDLLVLDPSNARSHSPRNIEVIKGSLARFGQCKPVVAGRDNVVLAGNGTLMAARALGWKHIAVVRVEFSDATAASFSLVDNKSAELASWDNHALATLLQSLRTEDELLAATGFNADEIAKLIAEQGGEIPADASGREYTEAIADDVKTCPHCGLPL